MKLNKNKQGEIIFTPDPDFLKAIQLQELPTETRVFFDKSYKYLMGVFELLKYKIDWLNVRQTGGKFSGTITVYKEKD